MRRDRVCIRPVGATRALLLRVMRKCSLIPTTSPRSKAPTLAGRIFRSAPLRYTLLMSIVSDIPNDAKWSNIEFLGTEDSRRGLLDSLVSVAVICERRGVAAGVGAGFVVGCAKDEKDT